MRVARNSIHVLFVQFCAILCVLFQFWFLILIHFQEMGPKTKLSKPNDDESDQSDSSESSMESHDEYSGNEVNLFCNFNIHRNVSAEYYSKTNIL